MQPPDVIPASSSDNENAAVTEAHDAGGDPGGQLAGQTFDDLARLTALVMRTPIAVVTLLAAGGRPVVRGAAGLHRAAAEVAATMSGCSICERVAAQGTPVALGDWRTEPAVDGGHAVAEVEAAGAVAYHCVPLVSGAGEVLGTLCAADTVPRDWTDDELELFTALAAQATREIELHRAAVVSERRHATIQRRLARSEELFRLAPAFICIVRGADHVYEFANHRYLEIVGHRSVIGRPVAEAVPELAAQGIVALLDDVLATGEPYVGSLTSLAVHRAPGEPPDHRYLSVVFQPLFGDDGTPDGVFVLGVDMTEELRASEQLVRQDELLLETQRLAHIGSWEFDVARGLVTWTDEMYRLHGVEPGFEPGVGGRYDSHVHPDDRERVRRAVDDAVAGDEPFAMDYRIVRPDGRVRSVHGRGRVERDADGRPVRLLGSCQDVTDRMETLSALRQSEERYRLVQQATRDVIWEWNLATGRVTMSDAAMAIVGYGPQDGDFAPDDGDGFSTDVTWWQERVHPDDRDRIVDSLREVIEGGGESWSGQYRFRGRDGGFVQLLTRARIMRDGSGRAIRVIGATEDRTEQCALEDQLRESQRMDSVGRLAGGIAHDFNNLLTVISASTTFARAEVGVDSRAAHDLDQIDQASRRAAELTRQLLAFSRRQILRPRSLNVNQQVDAMRAMMRRVIDGDVRIETVLTPVPRPARADPGQLDQVLLNLVLNACDAMPGGGLIRITTANVELDAVAARAYPGLAPGCYVSIAVADDGVGIPESLLPHIFEPFVTTKEPGKGTGLGLAMVYGIVRQSGGYVNAESTPGVGTTMTVLLPCDEEAAAAAAPDAPPPTAGGHETILLVEDDSAVRASIHRILSESGYDVLEAVNGEEALRIWHAHRSGGVSGGGIDLVLTDLVMPVLGGRPLVERLRAADPHSRIVIMSGYTADSEGLLAVLDGSNRPTFLQKPILPDLLLRTVRDVIEGREPDAD